MQISGAANLSRDLLYVPEQLQQSSAAKAKTLHPQVIDVLSSACVHELR